MGTTTRARPRLLTSEQERNIGEDLDRLPTESRFGRGSWNSKMAARRIDSRFDGVCSRRTALKIAGWLGFSTYKSRSISYNSATPEEYTLNSPGLDLISTRCKHLDITNSAERCQLETYGSM